MNHFRSSLSKMSPVALVLGLAACGGSNQPQATAPVGAYVQPQATATPEQYGSAMGQAAPGTSEYGATPSTPGTPGAMPPPEQGMPQMPSGSQYGTQGTPSGSQYRTTPQGQPGSQGMPGAATGGMTGGPPGMTGSPSPMGGSMDVSALNDAQLAAVILAIEQSAGQKAQLGVTKAMTPEVKRLADHLAASHQQMIPKTQATFTRLQITPAENQVSQQISSDGQTEIAALQTMGGRDFDREFLMDEIKGHNQAIELVDRMIPNVRNPELKMELQNLRPKLEAHLKEAERAQSMMQKGSPSRQGTSPGGNEPQR
jgi:putative membrane protein